MIPNQSGALVPRKDLKRDDGIPDSLKEIAESLLCGVWSRLVDLAILYIARDQPLGHVAVVLKTAVPIVMTENNVLDECGRQIEKRFPKTARFSNQTARSSSRASGFSTTLRRRAMQPSRWLPVCRCSLMM